MHQPPSVRVHLGAFLKNQEHQTERQKMAKYSLRKALQVKKNLTGEIAKLRSKISQFNCQRNANKHINVLELVAELDKLTNKLTNPFEDDFRTWGIHELAYGDLGGKVRGARRHRCPQAFRRIKSGDHFETIGTSAL